MHAHAHAAQIKQHVVKGCLMARQSGLLHALHATLVNLVSPAEVSNAPDGGQVVHARGLGLCSKGAQLATAAGDVDLRTPAVPVGAHAAEARALGRAARAQLRRQRRMRRLACRTGARGAMSHSSEGGYSTNGSASSSAASAACTAWPAAQGREEPLHEAARAGTKPMAPFLSTMQ